MPNVKMTEIIEVVDRNIVVLKAGDPSWTRQQKKNAKNAIDMMKTFKLLAEQSCTDTSQSIPTWPAVRAHGGAGKKTVRQASR